MTVPLRDAISVALRSGGLGLREGMNKGSAVGAIYQYPFKTTNPSLHTVYFIEYDSGYLFEFYG